MDWFIIFLGWAEHIKHHGLMGQRAGLHPAAGEEEMGCARKKGGANHFPSAARRTLDPMSQSSQVGLAVLLLYMA